MTDGQSDAAINQIDTTVAKRATDLQGPRIIPAVVERVLGQIGTREFHNFVGTPMEVWRLTALATGPDVVSGDDRLGKVIELTHFHCQQVRVAGPTPGEYDDALRVVLIDKDGTAYGFTSTGVARDLARIISTFGMGPYTVDPVKCRIASFQTNNKRRAFTIQPA